MIREGRWYYAGKGVLDSLLPVAVPFFIPTLRLFVFTSVFVYEKEWLVRACDLSRFFYFYFPLFASGTCVVRIFLFILSVRVVVVRPRRAYALAGHSRSTGACFRCFEFSVSFYVRAFLCGVRALLFVRRQS